MKGFILLIIAVLLIIPLTIWNLIVVKKTKGNIKGYFFNTAKNIDIWGNQEFRSLWNGRFITENGYQFGRENETISSVLGKNERDQTLEKLGKLLVKILNIIDKDHCRKSIQEL
jgi:hypothetical protein